MALPATNILDDLGYSDWTIKIINSGGGLCVHKTKEIWLDRKHETSTIWLLHEIAHIKYPDHSSLWADHFTQLASKYIEGHHY
jgi:hypothetical protein